MWQYIFVVIISPLFDSKHFIEDFHGQKSLNIPSSVLHLTGFFTATVATKISPEKLDKILNLKIAFNFVAPCGKRLVDG